MPSWSPSISILPALGVCLGLQVPAAGVLGDAATSFLLLQPLKLFLLKANDCCY